jgi:predicted short-subunit dehydrogenase-like oxidoreductase (DUF2520 family)
MAVALRAAGYQITEIVFRQAPGSRRRAEKLAAQVNAKARTASSALLDADVVWLCISDDAIDGCARELARRGSWKGRVALHSSGALTSDLLSPLRRRGAAVGSLHPMMTFVRGVAPDMRGVWFGVEGDPAAVRVARRIAQDLSRDDNVLTIRKKDKALYHALGSFTSPMVVALLALAEVAAREAGVSARSARALMSPILRRTIENYLKNGAAAAFSGPLRRGDVTVVKEHLKALRRVPGALDVYRALAQSALRTLPVGKKAQIRKALGM